MSRTIFVGDVHGCADELDALLDLVALTESDRVYFVGDLVARGPETGRVLDIVRAIRGRTVRGNHEQRLLAVRDAVAAGQPPPRLSPHHRQVLDALTEADWRLLAEAPFFLDIPDHGVRVVHAGLMPNLPLDEHTSFHFTHMRTIRRDGSPSDRLSGRLWAALYRGPEHVVFGHNAIVGLQLHEYATGIDTACVYGRFLTALVLPACSCVPPVSERRALLVRVPARRRYYPPTE